MQKINLAFLTLALTMAGFCALPTSALAQSVTPIMAFDQSWGYYQEGNQPTNRAGLDWKNNNYDDSDWPTGQGLLAVEDGGNYPPINTFLNLTAPGGTEQTRTFYFRTHFNFPSNTLNATLYFTNLVDDGAVVYLNGFEIYRYRVTGTPTYATFASGGPATEGIEEVFVLANSPRLRQGDNVLAVEVHQVNATSTDIVWGLGIAWDYPDPIIITEQPRALTPAVAGESVSLSVEVAGTSPRFWWFRNGVFLTGQTNPVLNLNFITTAQAGTYHVAVSNAISGARSSNAVVTVVPDTFGPRIIDAYIPIGETNRLVIQLNEGTTTTHANPLLASTNVANYFVSLLGRTNETNRIPITLALPNNGQRVVRLTMSTNFNTATNYQVCVKNIMDTRGNMIAMNSCVPVGFQAVTNPIPFQDVWFFHPWSFEPEGNWKALNYVEDPTRWGEAQATFHGAFSDTNHATCSVLNANLDFIYTSYFRKKFVLTTNLVGLKMDLTLTHAIDDGAVFYLNGTELTRFNMPPGPPVYGTRATNNVDNNCRTITFPDMIL